jgi:hypothetical protein
MIETLFVRASFLARLLEPPLGSYLESLARRLQAQNYSLGVIRNYVYAALRFGEWLSKQGLALSAVSTQLVRRYIDQFEKRITPAHPLRSATETHPRTGSPACRLAARRRHCRTAANLIAHGTMAGSL